MGYWVLHGTGFQLMKHRIKSDCEILLIDNNIQGVMVPKVYEDLCTRRILVSEWVDGKKLSECSTEEIAEVTPYAQEAFLTQLFEAGFFHADPHPVSWCLVVRGCLLPSGLFLSPVQPLHLT